MGEAKGEQFQRIVQIAPEGSKLVGTGRAAVVVTLGTTVLEMPPGSERRMPPDDMGMVD